ncbi:hypothetical protein OG559_22380 [Micromonospora sp. NBC_01405]|uniref:hypothetical protein n=1 Tax=Micromonospora sp. NBC_01405 TaxID=2903589 RepID=UPI003246318E
MVAIARLPRLTSKPSAMFRKKTWTVLFSEDPASEIKKLAAAAKVAKAVPTLAVLVIGGASASESADYKRDCGDILA